MLAHHRVHRGSVNPRRRVLVHSRVWFPRLKHVMAVVGGLPEQG